jgi:hypothetical protein
LPEVEGKKGIFYWDSGNYFEIIEWYSIIFFYNALCFML